MRCAVIHQRLDTQHRLAVRLLPMLRDALIELVVARASQQAGISLTEGLRDFGLADDQPQ
jgi:hypothetical protein